MRVVEIEDYDPDVFYRLSEFHVARETWNSTNSQSFFSGTSFVIMGLKRM